MLVAGIGNIFFRDDGFGPAVAAVLLSRARERSLPDGVRVVDYGIRGVHLAYDLLDGVDALVLVDAVPARTADGDESGQLITEPGHVVTLRIGAGDLGDGAAHLGNGDGDGNGNGNGYAHGMSPTAVLTGLAPMGGVLPPTYLVGCVPADVSEGLGLSEPVSAAVEHAAEAVVGLVRALASGELTSPDHAAVD